MARQLVKEAMGTSRVRLMDKSLHDLEFRENYGRCVIMNNHQQSITTLG